MNNDWLLIQLITLNNVFDTIKLQFSIRFQIHSNYQVGTSFIENAVS